MKLFGSSGIRGVVGEKITPELAIRVGSAFVETMGAERIGLCRDPRLSGPMLINAVAAGAMAAGADVLDFGILPTSVLPYIVDNSDLEGGIVITASHNPPEFNGFKLWDRNGMTLSTGTEEEIERWIAEGTVDTDWKETGTVLIDDTERHVDAYIDAVVKDVEPAGIKVVVDAGNGAASGLATRIFQKAGFEVFPINDEPDGRYPGRGAEPKAATLQGTVEYLRKVDADIAVCFDGDADRVVFADRDGFLGYNEMIGYLSRLAIQKGGIGGGGGTNTVVSTVETGRLLDLAVEDLGGSVMRGMVGDTHVARNLQDEGGVLGVEQVGHYIVPSMGYHPDVMLAPLFLLSNIDSVGEIREFFGGLPPLHYEKDGVDVPDEIKYDVVEKGAVVGNDAVSRRFPDAELNTTDGLRLEVPGGWLLVRASGTQPMIRIIAESEEKDGMEALLDLGREIVSDGMNAVKNA